MAETPTLLPPSSTPVERKLAQTGADIENVPLPIRTLRRAAVAPAALLPWLAWERSVDRWDDSWTVAAQRKAVANSFKIHQIKGTIGALRRVVEPLGYLLEVTEWHQMAPEGARGTFRLTIGVLDGGISGAGVSAGVAGSARGGPGCRGAADRTGGSRDSVSGGSRWVTGPTRPGHRDWLSVTGRVRS